MARPNGRRWHYARQAGKYSAPTHTIELVSRLPHGERRKVIPVRIGKRFIITMQLKKFRKDGSDANAKHSTERVDIGTARLHPSLITKDH